MIFVYKFRARRYVPAGGLWSSFYKFKNKLISISKQQFKEGSAEHALVSCQLCFIFASTGNKHRIEKVTYRSIHRSEHIHQVKFWLFSFLNLFCKKHEANFLKSFYILKNNFFRICRSHDGKSAYCVIIADVVHRS